jgi:hypothetical protein
MVQAADRTHFDSTTPNLHNTVGVSAEWDRLRKATWTLVREARARGDVRQLLTVLGQSLHQVQDFYTHSNWLEPRGRAGFDGPGWEERGFGTTPSWFDVPAETLNAERIYVGGADDADDARKHGSWKEDGNRDLSRGMNKDWPGRPLYAEAHMAAYFATRQWVRAVRSWVADEAFWQRVQRSTDRGGRDLAHDQRGMFAISFNAGHWQGQGEPCHPRFSRKICGENNGPGGSLLGLRSAVNSYFEDRGKTVFRRKWERLIQRVADPDPAGEVGSVPSSQDLQRATRFMRLRITATRDRGGFGPERPDFFFRSSIGNQEFRSGIINDRGGTYRFPRPNHPWTFLKALDGGAQFEEPVEDILAEVKTGDVRFAGTDDDVYLRIAPGVRLPLDKRLYDDFERDDRDTYSVPIDDLAERGLTVGDITRLGIEKSPDGIAGGWRLGGLRVTVNGRVIYRNDAINRWLEDSSRTFLATGFRPAARRRSAQVPVWLGMWDGDSFLRGDDDQADINPLDRRHEAVETISPTGASTRIVSGGSRHGGRLGDGDSGGATLRTDWLVPRTISVPSAPPVVTPDPPPSGRAGVAATRPSRCWSERLAARAHGRSTGRPTGRLDVRVRLPHPRPTVSCRSTTAAAWTAEREATCRRFRRRFPPPGRGR